MGRATSRLGRPSRTGWKNDPAPHPAGRRSGSGDTTAESSPYLLIRMCANSASVASAAIDRLVRRARLDHRAFAGPATTAAVADHFHPHLSRRVIQHFRDVPATTCVVPPQQGQPGGPRHRRLLRSATDAGGARRRGCASPVWIAATSARIFGFMELLACRLMVRLPAASSPACCSAMDCSRSSSSAQSAHRRAFPNGGQICCVADRPVAVAAAQFAASAARRMSCNAAGSSGRLEGAGEHGQPLRIAAANRIKMNFA